MNFKKLKEYFKAVLSDEEGPDEPVYDPAHVGAMIVIVLFVMTVLFWLLWALMVFGGGIQAKIVPLFQILFTAKTAGDFGYVGSPYAMGIFEGWQTNAVALVLALSVVFAVAYVFKIAATRSPRHES
ncbi:MAG: hypothetical protein NTU66_07575 [Elusimicrobia bacterium]|nr:hypothetical protein [Elusimicrobiota bacterium]